VNKEGFDRYTENYAGDRFYKEVFEQTIYEQILNAKSRDVIVDAGALAGEFAFWMLAHGAKKVYAIEPFLQHYEELVENIKLVGAEDQVIPFQIALAGENSQRSIKDNGRGGNVLINYDETKQPIEGVTLATFMQQNKIKRINILKIDVENAELEIFSASDFETVADKIDCIIGEHFDVLDDVFINKYGFKSLRGERNLVFYKENKWAS